MKLIPSDNLLKHLLEQNVEMPLGGFDIPDTAYADIDYDLRRHPIHSGESQVEIKDRVDYAAIWRFHGVAQNSGATGQALETVQKTASLTRQIVEMADTHLPNVAEKVSAAIDDSKNVVHAAVSELKSVTHLGQQDIVQAVSDLKMFSAESHAEVLKVLGDLHADLMELLAKLHHLGKWFLGVLIAGILFLCAIGILGMILGIHAHAQSTVIIGAQKGTTTSGAVTASDVDANHKALDVSIVAGGGTGGGPADTAPSATASESDVARQKVTIVMRLWDQTGLAGAQLVTARGDLTSGLWVNCKNGCAGGSTTPSNAFANPTTAGLSMSFNAMWNGTTWDLVKGDTTNGLWVNCKSGCAGGSSTPTDGFANPTTAGLSQGFTMMWNGASWDRVKGDTTSGLWVNIKNASLAVTGTFFQATQPVSWTSQTVTAVQPTGSNLHVVVDTAPSTAVTGPLTDTQLRASAVPISLASLPALAAGSAIIGKTSVDHTTPGTTDSFANYQPAVTTGNITTNASTIVAATTGMGSGSVTIHGTYVGVTFVFEFSDDGGTTWYPQSCGRTDVTAIVNGDGPLTSTARAYDCGFYGTTNFRVRATAYTSGTGVINITTSAAAIEPVPAVEAILSDGSGTAITSTGGALDVNIKTPATLPVSLASVPSHAVTNAGTFAVQATGTVADNGGAATTNRLGTLPAIALATPPAAATTGRDAALLTDLHRITYTSQMPTDVASYVASKQGLVSAASATDIAVLSGNASNTVIVTKIMVSCTQTTAGIIDLVLLKRSTADTAGTSTGSPTTVPLDSSNAAGSSSVLTYTANPTTGSLVGNVDVIKLGCMATGTTSPNDIYIWRPTMGQSIILRGTAQQIAVNLNAATVTGGNFNITIQWIEATNY